MDNDCTKSKKNVTIVMYIKKPFTQVCAKIYYITHKP